MNQDPNNPVMPTAGAPVAPDFTNPATAAAPVLSAAPVAPEMPAAPAMPETPATPEASTMSETPAMPGTPTVDATPTMPEAPTIDPTLLQQAIADVPEEAGATTSEPHPATIENPATPEVSPFTTAAPAADFTAAPETPAPAPAEPSPVAPEAQKSTPSVAFNDPASQPDAKPHEIKLPKIDLKKVNPVVLIVACSAIIIIALILILAFAV